MLFSSTGLIGTKRNDNFYFPYFSSFSDLFWLEMDRNRISFIFWIFYYFYGIFYYVSGRNGTEWNDNFYFSISHLFPTYFGLKWIHNGIFLIFLIILLFFWNFLLRIEQERNGTIIFIFSLSQPLPTYFGLKWGSNGIFLIFLNFFAIFFLEFSITHQLGTERNGTVIFISLFLIYFQPILVWNEFIMVFFNFFVIFL